MPKFVIYQVLPRLFGNYNTTRKYKGTIEEKIQALQETKKNLVTAVLDGNESRASMTVQEIKEILGIS